MGIYRLHYCNPAGNIFAFHDFEAEDDAAAIGRARRLARLKAPALELSQGAQLLYRSNYDAIREEVA